MTAFYTVIGIAAYVVGVVLSLQVLEARGSVGIAASYVVPLTIVTGAAVATGWWWFVSGVGERRLCSENRGEEQGDGEKTVRGGEDAREKLPGEHGLHPLCNDMRRCRTVTNALPCAETLPTRSG